VVDDNRELPFVVAVDEDKHIAVDCFIGGVGGENGCEHSEMDLLDARGHAPAHTRLAFGHTHPVWWTNPFTGEGGAEFPRCFGAIPSNIFADAGLWQEQARQTRDLTIEAALALNKASSAAEIVSELILQPKTYKRHGVDFCSFCAIIHQTIFLQLLGRSASTSLLYPQGCANSEYSNPVHRIE